MPRMLLLQPYALNAPSPVSTKLLNQTITALEKQGGRSLTSDEKKEVLEQMIDQILVIQAAEADLSVTVTDAEKEQAAMRVFSQQLQMQGEIPPGAIITDKNQYRQAAMMMGINIQELEANVRKQLLVEKYITTKEQASFQSIGPATADELNTEYQANLQQFVVSDSVWFNQIFFKTTESTPAESRAKGEKAREVYRRLMNTPATFPELVAGESEDEQSKARGGLMGPLMKGDQMAMQIYGANFMSKIFTMNVGDVSEPMQSNVGYHIVQITKKNAAQLLPVDDQEVKRYLEQVVYARKFQQVFDEASRRVVSDLRKRASIRYIGEYATQ